MTRSQERHPLHINQPCAVFNKEEQRHAPPGRARRAGARRRQEGPPRGGDRGAPAPWGAGVGGGAGRVGAPPISEDACSRLGAPTPSNPPHCPLTCLIMCLTSTELPSEQRGPSGGVRSMIAPSVPRAPAGGGGGGRGRTARARQRDGGGAGRGGMAAERRCLEKGDPSGRCGCQARRG